MDCETDEEFLCGEDEEYTYEEDPDYDDYQNDAEAGTKKDSEQMDLSSKDAPVEKNSQLMIPDGSYTVLNYADVRPILSAMVNEVSALLSVTLDEAELLLHFFQWDKEKITEDFLQDSDKCKLSAGLNLYSEEKLSCFLLPNSSKTVSSLPEKFQCRICYVEDLPLLSAGFSLGCGHAFCRNCYRSYLRNQIDEGPACVLAKCPEHKCQQSVTNLVFTSLLAEEQELVEKYERYVLQSFISRSKFMKYCPAPRCDKVAVGSGITTVRCTCSYPFCFRCGEEAHEPSSCAQLVEWMEKCLNESETANWILANTRKCPSCTTRIEKNQGCNHMSCKVCKHEFCWICMGDWAQHGQSTGGFYKCNRFDPAKQNPNETAAEKAKAELDRYLHYYQRYHGHDHSLKFAAAQRLLAEKRMIEQQESQQTSWIDVQFLKQATEQIIDCRRVLKYTYVLGYYLPDSTREKSLFEHHQEMLEKNTERLQECIETSGTVADRTQVVNLTRVTEKFMSSLLTKISGGVVLEEDFAVATPAVKLMGK